MILFSHPTGNANARQAALALEDAGLLEELWTGLAWNRDAPMNRMLPRSVRAQLARRAFPRALQGKIRTRPLRELGRLTLGRQFPRLAAHETGVLSVDNVYRDLDRRVARQIVSSDQGIYAYEDGARDSFRRAKQVGGTCFYDLPIGYWRVWHEIMAEEKEREPEWACTLQGSRDSAEKLARKDEELRLADVVFTASTFTRATLEQAPGVQGLIHTIPYGAPAVERAERLRPAESRRLRVLFVGSLGQRKGISYLVEAIDPLRRHVDLTLIGQAPRVSCAPLEKALADHRWIPSLPHPSILEEMRRHDVLVLPSLFEGFGLVVLEAMAQGLPVITTPHTAGPDVITDGEDGFIVPIRSAEAIRARLEALLSNPERLRAMQNQARRTAARFTWDEYRRRLAKAVGEVIAKKSPVAA